MAKAPPKALRLQTSVLPKQQRSTSDPHQPMSLSMYRPANLRETTFEKTTDAYMYDVLFYHFQHDKNFWSSWRVVDCAASVPDKSQKQACWHCGTAFTSIREDVCRHCGHKRDQGRAAIRVVMDLPGMSELPRSYPPPPVGRDKPRSISGLPSGYSVPLEAFTIEDGQMLLERQRVFNDGHIDPRYQWLQDIITSARQRKADGDNESGASMAPQPKQKATSVRGFMSWLSGAVGVAEQTDASGPLSSYGRNEPRFEERNSLGQVGIAREGLVSPYNSRKVVAGPFRPGEAEEKLSDVEVLCAAEGNQLDLKLQELLSRTMANTDARDSRLLTP